MGYEKNGKMVYTDADSRSNKKNQDKRVELNREARKRGIYGKRKGMGKDLSHGEDGSLRLEDRSANRSRNGHNGKSTLRKSATKVNPNNKAKPSKKTKK